MIGDRAVGCLLAPTAYAASVALWPVCVWWAWQHRTWADALDDAALALAGHQPPHPSTHPEEDAP